MGLEQRHHKRLLFKENTFLALENGKTTVGGIKDLSKGGSSFEYFSGETLPIEGQMKLDIFIFGNKFRLSEIPCNVTYDTPINKPLGRNGYVPPFIIKRCGVQFGDLTKKQHEQLLYFLDNHNTGAVA